MGSIIERPRKDGTIRFQAMVKIPGGKAFVRTCDTRDAAQIYIDSIEDDRQIFKEIARKKHEKDLALAATLTEGERRTRFMSQSLSAVLKEFAESNEASDRVKRNLPTILRKVGDVTVGEVRKAWVRKYVSKVLESKSQYGTLYAPSTVLGHMHAMASAIKWSAENWDVTIGKLPFSSTYLPANWDVKRERRLEKYEQIAILNNLRLIDAPSKQHWRYIFRLALETGARQQELVNAEWSEFDLSRRVWSIPANHTKTKSARSIPLSKCATRILRMLRLTMKQDNTRVFHRLGTPGSVSGMFHRYTLAAGVIDYRFHDLRHEAISRMVFFKRELSVFEIMKIAGHKSLDMLNRYANLRGEELVDRMG